MRGSDLTSYGSVVASAGTSDCSIGGTTASTYSYDDDGTCGFADATDVSDGVDPLLGALEDNGGPTLTRLPGAPLVDQIPSAACDATVTTDQRGVNRPQTSHCDIGAVEILAPEHTFGVDPQHDIVNGWQWGDVGNLVSVHIADNPSFTSPMSATTSPSRTTARATRASTSISMASSTSMKRTTSTSSISPESSPRRQPTSFR